MYLQTLPNPVESSYAGGDSIAVRRLQEFCGVAQGNFNTIQAEMLELKMNQYETNKINAKLVQFMNWLAVTNPQILDEFQNTANAFEKLSPRNDGGEAETCAPA